MQSYISQSGAGITQKNTSLFYNFVVKSLHFIITLQKIIAVLYNFVVKSLHFIIKLHWFVLVLSNIEMAELKILVFLLQRWMISTAFSMILILQDTE